MYSASALAATTSLRSMAAFGFPLFATNMYDAIGHGTYTLSSTSPSNYHSTGWGNTLLALVAFLVGGPGSLMLYLHGPRLRQLSPYAAGDKY